jgi:hypothetical protein
MLLHHGVENGSKAFGRELWVGKTYDGLEATIIKDAGRLVNVAELLLLDSD